MILFDSVVGLFDDQPGDFDHGGVVNATAAVTGLQATSSIGTVSAAGVQSPTQAVTGLEATSAFASVTATGTESRTATVTGQSATASVGTAIAIGEGDGIATVSGVIATSSIGTVTVPTQTNKKGRKRNAKFLEFNPRPVSISIEAKAQLSGVSATTGANSLVASATVSGRAQVFAINAQTDIQTLEAGGIINPTDEELIFLLAA